MDLGAVVKELIKLSPFGGFALVVIWLNHSNTNKHLDRMEGLFDKSLNAIKDAQKDAVENTNKFIEIISEKFGGGGKK